MQITLVQSEIEEAISRFIRSKMTISTDCKINIDLRATRGVDGATAIIDVLDKTLGDSDTASVIKFITEDAGSSEPVLEEPKKKLFSALKESTDESTI